MRAMPRITRYLRVAVENGFEKTLDRNLSINRIGIRYALTMTSVFPVSRGRKTGIMNLISTKEIYNNNYSNKRNRNPRLRGFSSPHRIANPRVRRCSGRKTRDISTILYVYVCVCKYFQQSFCTRSFCASVCVCNLNYTYRIYIL